MTYRAIKTLYLNGLKDAEWVRSCVPKFITEEQAEEIIALR